MKQCYLILLLFFFVSCKKNECKECYVEETNSSTNQTQTTSLGKKCGDELDNFEDKEYVGVTGPARSYCKK